MIMTHDDLVACIEAWLHMQGNREMCLYAEHQWEVEMIFDAESLAAHLEACGCV